MILPHFRADSRHFDPDSRQFNPDSRRFYAGQLLKDLAWARTHMRVVAAWCSQPGYGENEAPDSTPVITVYRNTVHSNCDRIRQ